MAKIQRGTDKGRMTVEIEELKKERDRLKAENEYVNDRAAKLGVSRDVVRRSRDKMELRMHYIAEIQDVLARMMKEED